MFELDCRETLRKYFSASCRPPASCALLEPLACIADQANATTAEASSSTGHTVQVTDPPAISHVCVHCPGLTDADFTCAEKDLLLLLSVTFSCRPDGPQYYFVYKASRQQPRPAVTPPAPTPLTPSNIGLLPPRRRRPFRAGRHLLYAEQLFSSATSAWCTKVPQADV